jgi:hypothetical protein
MLRCGVRREKDKEHVWEAKDKRTYVRNKPLEGEPDQGFFL